VPPIGRSYLVESLEILTPSIVAPTNRLAHSPNCWQSLDAAPFEAPFGMRLRALTDPTSAALGGTEAREGTGTPC